MNLSNIFKSKDNNEKFLEKILRKLGFIGITICSIALNMNFFQSLGESWVMPVCGIILVFMEIYHWINTQYSTGIRRFLHFIAWLAICLTSILSVVSFGQTITAVSSDKVIEAKADEKTKSVAKSNLYLSAQNAYNAAQKQIDTANTLMGTLGPYDKGPQERLAKQIEEASTRQTKAFEDMKKYSGINEKTDDTKVTQEDVKKNINARIIFSKIFSEEHADTAIKGFFILFGIAMELTLSLSAMPPQKRIKKNRRKISTLLWSFVRIKLQKQLNSFEKKLEKEEKEEPKKEKARKKTTIDPIVLPEEINVPEIKEAVITPVEVPLINESNYEDNIIMERDDSSMELVGSTDEDTIVEEPTVIEEPTVVEETLVDLMMPDDVDHKAESETAFLFKDSPITTLTVDEKKLFIENTIKILAEIKRNSSGELSVKQMSSNVGISIDEVKRMFKYFFNRNLLQYDDSSSRWKFKLKQDSIINYLKDKTVQY